MPKIEVLNISPSPWVKSKGQVNIKIIFDDPEKSELVVNAFHVRQNEFGDYYVSPPTFPQRNGAILLSLVAGPRLRKLIEEAILAAFRKWQVGQTVATATAIKTTSTESAAPAEHSSEVSHG